MLSYQLFNIQPKDYKMAANVISPNYFQMPLICAVFLLYLCWQMSCVQDINFSILVSRCSPQSPILKMPTICFVPLGMSLYPYKTTGKLQGQ